MSDDEGRTLNNTIETMGEQIERLRAELAFTRGERDAGTIVATREIARVLRERNAWRAAWHRMAACLSLPPSDDPIGAVSDRVQVLILENDALKRGAQ